MTDSADTGATATPTAAARPDYVPEKFWDAQGRQVRVEALSKSYGELERKLSGMVPGPKSPEWEQGWRRAMGVPDTADGYGIALKDDSLTIDPDVNQRLHAAGFTPAQAQLVYDLASERLVPLVREYADSYRTEVAREKLAAEFGGAEKWDALAPQIARWGQANLPKPVYEALASTPEGVRALNRLMSSGEPDLNGLGSGARPLDEEGLRKLMADKRYWRDHDPEVARVVSEGFRRLYPDREA
ncbi:MAG: hypothetical protein GC202_01240 [Alphaproteobacteria bacterium]|nr:hypothetical protein [Alphaproteobacteria bacterium]